MNRSRSATGALVWLLVALAPGLLQAQEAETRLDVPGAAEAPADFDAEVATQAYLTSVPAEARERSDAYFEGGYWLLLWNVLLSTAIFLGLLITGISARMRDVATRVTRRRSVHVFIYWTQLVLAVSVLAFPLTVYQGFVREHSYGLANQSVGSWMGDQLTALVLTVVLGGLFMVVLNCVVRRAATTWWIWGSGVAVGFVVLGGLVSPVYIAPLFNTYSTLADPDVADPILSLARANGIPVSEIYVMDASRQSTRISANVSGFLGTQRITLNDNLLHRTSPEEIQAVMGHEMGHYVLNHVYKGMLFISILLVTLFGVLYKTSGWALARWGGRWGVTTVEDVASLPLLGLISVWFMFLATPALNNQIRTQEYEADIFGLNAARQPDGMAAVSLKLGEYRKLDPSPWEEVVFFDHPSGRTRILASMRWKAEHIGGAR